MRFEISNGHLGGIASVATWWHKFIFHVVFVSDQIFHGCENFVVEYMFPRGDTCLLEAG
jgi:hypothetical protein